MSNSPAEFAIEPIQKTSTNTSPFDPTNPGDWSNPPTTLQGAIDQLARRRQEVILGGLGPGGVFYPNNFIGPGFGSYSSASVTAYGSGSGFYRITQAGILSHFSVSNAVPPASNISVDLQIAPSANPFLFVYSGVTITIGANNSVADNYVDTLSVNVDDIIVLYNPSFFVGYSPSTIVVTAQFLPNL